MYDTYDPNLKKKRKESMDLQTCFLYPSIIIDLLNT